MGEVEVDHDADGIDGAEDESGGGGADGDRAEGWAGDDVHADVFEIDLQEHIERWRDDVYQKRLRDQLTEPLCALHVDPHHHVITLRQGVTHLLFRHTVVVVVHLRPFQQFVGRNHVYEIVDRHEMVVYAILFTGPGIARGGSDREMESDLARFDHAVDHHVFADARWTGDYNHQCVRCGS